MNIRNKIISDYYNETNEDNRLQITRQGQLEYEVTMNYIHRFLTPNSRILEIGAGTGRYSIALAKEGYSVTAIELIEKNLNILKEHSKDLDNLKSYQGDALDLSALKDGSFDMTLVFGPMYHLYEKEDIDKAIDEALRVTKKNGIIMFSFISVFGIMYSNYFHNNWIYGQIENFTHNYETKHFTEQLFTGYDVNDFEGLFKDKSVKWITTTGTDGVLELVEKNPNFRISDADFNIFIKWYLHFSEKRELLGSTNHLLSIYQKI